MACYHDEWKKCEIEIDKIHSSISNELSEMESNPKQITKEQLREMYDAISAKGFYRCTNYLTNVLAQSFDECVTNSRKNKPLQKTQFLSSHHVFLVIPKDKNDKESYSITARMYHGELPPDERLIQIKVGKKALRLRPLLSILHEMGHFLGVRCRQERYQTVFLPLVMNAFFQQIYQHACIGFSGWDEKKGLCNFADSALVTPKVHVFARQVIGVLNRAMSDTTKHLDQMCIITMDHLLEVWRKKSTGEAKTIQDRNCAAMEQKFFCSIREVILSNLQMLVQDPSLFVDQVLMPHIQETDLSDIVSLKDMRNYLAQGVKKTAQELEEENGTAPAWYDKCEKELEEPIADIFMLKVSGMSTKKYITHLLTIYRSMELYQVKNKEKQYDVTTLMLEDIQRNENASRIIGIVLARNESAVCFERWYDGIIKHIPWENKYRQLYQARMILQAMYYHARSCPTKQQQKVYDYIKKVWDDDRFADEFNCMKREFTQKQRLLQLLKWLL